MPITRTDAEKANPLKIGMDALGWVGEKQDQLDKAVGIGKFNVYNARHLLIDPVTNAASRLHPAAGVAANIGMEMLVPDSTLYAGKILKGIRGIGKVVKGTRPALAYAGVTGDVGRVSNVKISKSAQPLMIKGGQPNAPNIKRLKQTYNQVEDVIEKGTKKGLPKNPTKAQWKAEAKRLRVEEGLPMKEVRNKVGNKWVDPETGAIYRIHDHRGVDIDVVSDAVRKTRGAKRTITEKIPVAEVEKLAVKYKQPASVVKGFMEDQHKGHKAVKDMVKKINQRIAKNREFYGPTLKASKGHGKAAKRYPHSGDIVSNLDLEDHVTNITRSNKDEISDAFNRALGRSNDLDEEFLKFIDPDLRSFHSAFRLGRHQKDAIIDYVVKGMDKNINWKGPKTAKGKQLYSSKEEFLVNEALQKFIKGK